MNKLKTVVQFECITSARYIAIFYAIEYTIVLLISIMVAISTGKSRTLGVGALEANTLIYVGVVGVLGVKEDFKMLIQNGFTRKYIFIGAFAMFAFISGIMALVDTAVGNILHRLVPSYDTLYGNLYGYENLLMNWLWLFLVYVLICSLLYFGVLVIHKIGKTASIYLGASLGGVVLLVAALFRFVLSGDTVRRMAEFAARAMGFMQDGTVQHGLPVLTLLLCAAVLGLSAYTVLRRTELR